MTNKFKRLTTDYAAKLEDAGPLFEILMARRSYRAFDPTPLSSRDLTFIHEVLQLSVRVRRAASTRFVIIVDKEQRKRFLRAAYKGLAGKINPWLPKTEAPAFIVMCGEVDAAPRYGDRLQYLVEVAMVTEDLFLAAAERGIGTCWMAGFNEKQVAEVIKLPETMRIIAISPLGYLPKKISRLSWDRITNRLLSCKRLPLEHLVFLETVSTPFPLEQTDDE